MQFINSQYKVINLLREDKNGSILVVEDVHIANIVKCMRLIDLNKETLLFIEYMKNNLYDYVNFLHPNMSEFYFFNKINMVDNKPTTSNRYYYTYEYKEGENLFAFSNNKSFETLLELFMQLASLIKHLHLRGYLLCNVNSSELNVINVNDSYQLKVSSLFYLSGTDNDVMIDKDNNYFKSPESLQYGSYSKSSDIYLLGAIMFYMFSGKDMEESNFREDLIEFRPDKDSELYRLINIIKKCAALDPAERYNSIDELVNDINRQFAKNYNIVHKDYLQKMPRFIVRPVGRQRHINKILNNTREYFFEGKSIKSSILTCPPGTGKVTFLKAIEFRMEQEGYVFSSVALRREASSRFYVASTLVKNIIKYIDKDLVEKYIEDLSYVISEEQLLDLKEDDRIRLVYRLGNFLLEAASKSYNILIIDNFQYIDNDSLEIMKYVLKKENRTKLYIFLSLDSEEVIDKKEIKEYYNLLLESEICDLIELGNFNINETSEYIKLLLGMEYVPLDFVTKVFKETEGSPDYIYEIIYMLYTNGSIFVDDNGSWNFDNVDMDKLSMSFDIDDITLNKINKLDPVYQEILKIISIFDTAVSSDILEEMTNIKGEELFELLDYLTYINITSRKVDDWGITYDFSSMNLKKSIYEKIQPEEKQNLHNRASYILEDKFTRENRENRDELIHHMTKANRYNEAIEHLMSSAEKMMDSNLINQAIQFLEQTYDLFDENDTSLKKIHVSLNLGDLYNQLGNYQKSMYYYDKIEEIGNKINDSKILADAYIKKFSLLYRLDNYKQSIMYAIKARKIIKEISYYEGMYELIVNMSHILINRRKYNTYINILERSLDTIEKDKYPLYYARLLIVYGRVLTYKDRFEEGLEVLLKSVELLEKLGAYKYLPEPLNTIGFVYSDYYNDPSISREYYEKCLSISQKTNNLYYIEYSYNNLAEMYRLEDNYKEAFDYFNHALEIIKVTRHKYSECLIHLNIMLIDMAMEDYNKALQSYSLAEKIIRESKDLGNLEEYLYCNKAEFMYHMGEYRNCKEAAQKTIDICKSWGVAENLEAHMYKILAETQQSGKLDYDRHMEFCERTFSDNLYKLGRITCIRFAEIYADKGMHEQAESFLELGRKYIE
ncbi:MAG: protein kinase, partial [Bacillota bacterium]